jgi:hypothetical protein
MNLLGRRLSVEEFITYQCGPYAATNVMDIVGDEVVAEA